MQTINFNNKNSTKNNNKKPTKTCLQSAIDYFHEYCNYSTIHGFLYIGERRTIFEKIWWSIVFILCIIGLSFTIAAVYNKWNSSPVVVTFASKSVPIYSVPFPAVTICSEEKIKQNVFNYTRALLAKRNGETLNQNDENIFGQFHYMCHRGATIETSQSDSENFFQLLETVSPKLKFIDGLFVADPIICDEEFIPIIIDEGICYTFNMISRAELLSDTVVHYSNYHVTNMTSKNWTGDEYKEETSYDTYPYRALLPGARTGLDFTIQSVDLPIDRQCTTSLRGFKILIHSPLTMPRLNLEFSRVDLDNSAAIIVSPSIISTSDAVKAYDPQRRQCFFQSERKLQYFKFYSESNCRLECLSNATLKICRCVIFYMPRKNGTRICAGADFNCTEMAYSIISILLARQTVLTLYFPVTMNNVELSSQFEHTNFEFDTGHMDEIKSCNCLPLCSDIDYNVVVSQTSWDWSLERQNAENAYSNDSISNLHFTKFSIYFSKNDFRAAERNELYGPTDFLANFGGLLGLFTGFSILSLMEIIYFLTLRLVANKKLYSQWVAPAK